MGFFNWAAPLIRLYGNRFGDGDSHRIAQMLRPAVSNGGSILDVGGGAGQLAHLLADELDAYVTVLDPTPEMLDHVKTDDRVSAVGASAEDIPFPDDSFDALVVTDPFHHFTDQPTAVREFARVVRHNGLVLVLELDPTKKPMRFIAFGEKLLGEPAAFLSPTEMCAFMSKHGLEGECSPEDGYSYHFLGCVQKQADEEFATPRAGSRRSSPPGTRARTHRAQATGS
jgi:demethylmenaquinone methyltransferase/2-methoxy-6-polyprenyl-1,4-benzoquinol methylase